MPLLVKVWLLCCCLSSFFTVKMSSLICRLAGCLELDFLEVFEEDDLPHLFTLDLDLPLPPLDLLEDLLDLVL